MKTILEFSENSVNNSLRNTYDGGNPSKTKSQPMLAKSATPQLDSNAKPGFGLGGSYYSAGRDCKSLWTGILSEKMLKPPKS